MRQRTARVAIALWALAGSVVTTLDAAAQFGETAFGPFYTLELPTSADRVFGAVNVERVAPGHLAPPTPIGPLPLPVGVRALTGQIFELPERQRLFFTAVDVAGAVRLFGLDLMSRQTREVLPPGPLGPPFGLRLLAAPDGSKLYVQWLAAGALPETDIYDGETFRWLDRTAEFRPDARALRFQHRPPLLWTMDDANRLLLVDSHADRILRSFSRETWFGPSRGEIADAWRDLVLVRLDAGHDRYHVVDAISGEIGPPLDIAEYRRAEPRLVLDGRFLVLIDSEPRPPSRYLGFETAVARGTGEIYDLRSGAKLDDLELFVGAELPVSSVGTVGDPSVAGRLWVFASGTHQRFDLPLHACRGKAPGSDSVAAVIEAFWDPDDDPLAYRYALQVGRGSETAAGAFAVRAERAATRLLVPGGWGVDQIKGERWVRWMNGLGPSDEDVSPGERTAGFGIDARAGTRPGIVEQRIQASTGLPRGCESEDHFLKNSVAGHTIGPEEIKTDDPRKLARRLVRLTDQACDLGWIERTDCRQLQAAAARVLKVEVGTRDSILGYHKHLAGTPLDRTLALMLTDAASAALEALGPRSSQ